MRTNSASSQLKQSGNMIFVIPPNPSSSPSLLRERLISADDGDAAHRRTSQYPRSEIRDGDSSLVLLLGTDTDKNLLGVSRMGPTKSTDA